MSSIHQQHQFHCDDNNATEYDSDSDYESIIVQCCLKCRHYFPDPEDSSSLSAAATTKSEAEVEVIATAAEEITIACWLCLGLWSTTTAAPTTTDQDQDPAHPPDHTYHHQHHLRTVLLAACAPYGVLDTSAFSSQQNHSTSCGTSTKTTKTQTKTNSFTTNNTKNRFCTLPHNTPLTISVAGDLCLRYNYLASLFVATRPTLSPLPPPYSKYLHAVKQLVRSQLEAFISTTTTTTTRSTLRTLVGNDDNNTRHDSVQQQQQNAINRNSDHQGQELKLKLDEDEGEDNADNDNDTEDVRFRRLLDEEEQGTLCLHVVCVPSLSTPSSMQQIDQVAATPQDDVLAEEPNNNNSSSSSSPMIMTTTGLHQELVQLLHVLQKDEDDNANTHNSNSTVYKRIQNILQSIQKQHKQYKRYHKRQKLGPYRTQGGDPRTNLEAKIRGLRGRVAAIQQQQQPQEKQQQQQQSSSSLSSSSVSSVYDWINHKTAEELSLVLFPNTNIINSNNNHNNSNNIISTHNTIIRKFVTRIMRMLSWSTSTSLLSSSSSSSSPRSKKRQTRTIRRMDYYVACFRRPIFLYGYYTKSRRDVSQSPFIVRRPKQVTSAAVALVVETETKEVTAAAAAVAEEKATIPLPSSLSLSTSTPTLVTGTAAKTVTTTMSTKTPAPAPAVSSTVVQDNVDDNDESIENEKKKMKKLLLTTTNDDTTTTTTTTAANNNNNNRSGSKRRRSHSSSSLRCDNPTHLNLNQSPRQRRQVRRPNKMENVLLGVTSVEEQLCSPVEDVLGISSHNNIINSESKGSGGGGVKYGMIKFHASGREDMDVRMMVKKKNHNNNNNTTKLTAATITGRPFCLQIIDALRPIASTAQLKEIIHKINHTTSSSSSSLYVSSLLATNSNSDATTLLSYGQNPFGVGISSDCFKVVPGSVFSNLQKETESKKKYYGCYCWSEKSVKPPPPPTCRSSSSSSSLIDINAHDVDTNANNGDDLTSIIFKNISFPLTVQQRTPLRVVHRRSDLVRERKILSAKATRVTRDNNGNKYDTSNHNKNHDHDHYFRLELIAEAGTYIKEFVHSDQGRTVPSISSLLSCETKLLQLDCEGIQM